MEAIGTITAIHFHIHTQICNFIPLVFILHASGWGMGRGVPVAEYSNKRPANVLLLKMHLLVSLWSVIHFFEKAG